MKVLTVTDKGRKRKILTFQSLYGLNSWSYDSPSSAHYPTRGKRGYTAGSYTIIRHERRLAVTWDPRETVLCEGAYETWASAAHDAAFQAGPKTLIRVLQKALNDESGELNVRSTFGEALVFEGKGEYCYFRAPCGQNVRVTKNEVRRVLEAIPALLD